MHTGLCCNVQKLETHFSSNDGVQLRTINAHIHEYDHYEHMQNAFVHLNKLNYIHAIKTKSCGNQTTTRLTFTKFQL